MKGSCFFHHYPQMDFLFVLNGSFNISFQPLLSKHLLLLPAWTEMLFLKSSLSAGHVSGFTIFSSFPVGVKTGMKWTGKSCRRMSFSKYAVAAAVLLSTCNSNLIPMGGPCFGMWRACCANEVAVVTYRRKFLSLSWTSLLRDGITMK